MLRTIAGLVPFAVVLVAVGAAIWWLLDREWALGKWLLAGFLLAHGLLHLLFLAPATASGGGTDWPFSLGQSWLVTAGLGLDMVKLIGTALVVAVAAAFAVAAASTAGIVVPAGWWRPAVVASVALSALTLIAYFSPQLILGLGIDAVLLWVALTAAWVPAAG